MRNAAFVGAVVLAMSTIGYAQQQPPPTQPPAPRPATGDKAMSHDANMTKDHHFVTEAASGGMAEVELGKLASEKATSPEVKKFGERMADDHGKANDELKTLAQNKSITLPNALDAKHKATVDRLSKLTGEAFDRAYMQEMLKDHKTDVAAFRTESKSGKDADIKAWAAKTLPTLEEHLKLAQDANRAVGTSGTMPKKNPK